mmetsp:Transcript_35415/g.69336  ORF Transcript_35415/g.69336 Transcript_35415/m.69336 type:complete len:220 (-) Transcript_35415:283-942(-)
MSCVVHPCAAGAATFEREGFEVGASRQRILGAKQSRDEEGAWGWAPNSKRTRTDAGEGSVFMERTSRLFEELKAEAHARITEWNKVEASNRAESRRIAELYPIKFAQDLHTPTLEPLAGGATPAAMEATSPASPSTDLVVGGAVSQIEKKSASRMLSARETPAMGPAKHSSPTIDTSAFSRSLSFKPSSVMELFSSRTKGEVDALPDLALPPPASQTNK